MLSSNSTAKQHLAPREDELTRCRKQRKRAVLRLPQVATRIKDDERNGRVRIVVVDQRNGQQVSHTRVPVVGNYY